MCDTDTEREVSPEVKEIREKITIYLDTLPPEDRAEHIDDLLHSLNFERRLTLLTPEEREHMNACGDTPEIVPSMKEKLDNASPSEREKIIEAMARAQYFRQCAWADYLNGVKDEKPFDSELAKGQQAVA